MNLISESNPFVRDCSNKIIEYVIKENQLGKAKEISWKMLRKHLRSSMNLTDSTKLKQHRKELETIAFEKIKSLQPNPPEKKRLEVSLFELSLLQTLCNLSQSKKEESKNVVVATMPITALRIAQSLFGDEKAKKSTVNPTLHRLKGLGLTAFVKEKAPEWFVTELGNQFMDEKFKMNYSVVESKEEKKHQLDKCGKT